MVEQDYADEIIFDEYQLTNEDAWEVVKQRYFTEIVKHKQEYYLMARRIIKKVLPELAEEEKGEK